MAESTEEAGVVAQKSSAEAWAAAVTVWSTD